MISNPVIFYLASVLIITFALMAIFARKVVYSLLCSIVVFFLGALFFYMLGSEYNAIIQAAIYGFAVPVIVGVSIMFGNSISQRQNKMSITSYLVLLCSGIFFMAIVYLVMMSLVMKPDTFHIMDWTQINSFDTLRAFAKGIFIDYVWAFELISILLTIVNPI